MRRPRTPRSSGRTEFTHLVPASGDLADLVDAVAAMRSRPITLMPVELAGDAPSGLWIATQAQDYIAYPANADAPWRSGIVCHELAHMLLEHAPRPGTAELTALTALTAHAAPSIDPAVAARFLQRHGYGDAAEVDAERLGTTLAAALGAAHRSAHGDRDRVFDRMT